MSQSASSTAVVGNSPGRPRRAALLPLLLLVVVGSMLGVTAVNAKAAALAGWPPLALLAWANLGAASLQLAGGAVAGRRVNTGRRYLAYYLVSGLLAVLPNTLLFAAAPHVGAGIVALAFAFPLILTYALALALGMERLQALRLAGVLLGLGGGLVITLGDAVVGLTPSLWLLAAAAAPVVLAVGNLYRTLHWPAGADALDLSPGMLAVGGLALVIGLTASGLPLQPAAWSPAMAGFLAAQTAIFTLFYLLFFLLQKLAGPVYLSQIGSVGALVGIALATLVLDEALTAKVLIAGALVAGGIVLVNRRPQARTAPRAADPR